MLDSIILKPGKDVAVKHGHPWIFSGAISNMTGKVSPGALVLVLDSREVPLGVGYCNPKSGITVRMLTRDPAEVINTAFFVKKISALKEFKESWIDAATTNSYRVVFAESDGIPGLIVDKYNDVLVLQAHTAGIDVQKATIVEALKKVYSPRAIFERSDLSVRKIEGLPDQPTGLLSGALETTEVEIMENGLKFIVDIAKGQKTGFFMDQRENRMAAAHYAKNRTCLNICSYTGAFSVAMLQGGAKQVVNVDSSESANEMARINYNLNKLEAIDEDFVVGDAFDALAGSKPGQFDLILLDPPAFSKTVKEAPQALKAYTKLNALAIEALPKNGILITSSCSGAVKEDDFMNAIRYAAERSGATLRLLEKRAQPVDHAVNPSFPEGAYLKFFVFCKV
ncbi:MAG: class I SAM-dependent rRNA methyltransferase [bacterium]